MSPLGVISLFVSLTEVVTGIAMTQAEAGIQIALTSFVIVFPFSVAAAFFVILWDRPHVFYPPSEYGPDVDVTQFAAAMRSGVDIDKIESALSQDETGDRIRAFIWPADGDRSKPPNRDNQKKLRSWMKINKIDGLAIQKLLDNPALKDERKKAIKDIPIPQA